MRKGKLLKKITDQAGLYTESMPGYPLIEISGNDRLLVEKHRSILSYSENSLKIQMPYGTATIEGTSLVMTQLSKEQLVIHGRIRHILLSGEGECP